MQRTLCETKLPLSIVEECLMQREKRLGIECTHDEVERTLCKVCEHITTALMDTSLLTQNVTIANNSNCFTAMDK